MKIYTKRGDGGKTALIGGVRVSKDSLRIEAYGTVDELNSYLGLLVDKTKNKKDIGDFIKYIQDRLFTLGAILASDPKTSKMSLPDLQEDDVILLETAMDKMNETLPELKNFILPGGNEAASVAHIARCVCRRGERLAVALAVKEQVPEITIKYLNRLSDYLFVLARKLVKDAGNEEIEWTPRKGK